jgi:TatD DNase family protein
LHDSRVVDADLAWSRAQAAGVTGALLAGVEPEGWDEEDRLARRLAGLTVSYGVHPQRIAELSEAEARARVGDLDRELSAGQRLRPVAVGEIGLDGVAQRVGSLPRQAWAFREQLALAGRHDLPVVLHVLKAHGPALEILEAAPPRAGVLHSCSASAELTRRYLRLGLAISFAGSVTWVGARKVKEAVKVVPRERLLVESDAPDQTPQARRPGPNEPAFLVEIIAAIAQIRGESPALVAAYTAANARRLFRIKET